jgi:hypothetical protein
VEVLGAAAAGDAVAPGVRPWPAGRTYALAVIVPVTWFEDVPALAVPPALAGASLTEETVNRRPLI